MNNMLYFAYGSNLNAEQMKCRCPGAVEVAPAVLHGWKLVERIYADIEEAADSCVNGALYEITGQDLALLDLYEGYPDFYTRLEVPVVDRAGAEHRAIVYTMTVGYKDLLAGGAWSEEYRAVCSEGAEHWGIPNAFERPAKKGA